MQIAGFAFISLSILSFFIFILLCLIYRTFKHNLDATDNITAQLIDVKYKKNVKLYEQRFLHGPVRAITKIKDYTKGKYEYKINKKCYTITYAECVTIKQMPKFVSVIYIKRFPKIAYVKTEVNTPNFEIYSMIFLAFSVSFLFFGFSLLF